MTPPAPMKCLKTGCEWHTPQNCPTWANQIELMKIHTNKIPLSTHLTNPMVATSVVTYTFYMGQI